MGETAHSRLKFGSFAAKQPYLGFFDSWFGSKRQRTPVTTTDFLRGSVPP